MLQRKKKRACLRNKRQKVFKLQLLKWLTSGKRDVSAAATVPQQAAWAPN
jgi:hypothetical protein